MSGTSDGCNLIQNSKELLDAILALVDDKVAVIGRDAVLVLVNVSASEYGAAAVLNARTAIVKRCLDEIVDENSSLAEPCAMLLSNLSRPRDLVGNVLETLLQTEHSVEKLMTSFTRVDHNKKGMQLDYVGPIFSNLTQCAKGREIVCDPQNDFLHRILPFVNQQSNLVRRGGATGVLKNICFDTGRHEWLMSEQVNVLPFILLPLAGPEEYDDEDNDKFPIELQYLDTDKEREFDPDLRIMLLDTIAQLCATRKSRDYLRSKGTYEILREYHKWESKVGENKVALLKCENVVNILIRTEEEIGEDDLTKVDVPEDLKEKFDKFDEDEISSAIES